MNMYRIAFIILTILCLRLPLTAGVSAVGSVDREKATIGDRVRYRVAFTHPASGEIVIPEKHPGRLGEWEIRSVETERDPKTSGSALVYTLSAFTTGQVVIPEISFTYRDGKNERELKTAPATVTIESLLARYGDAGDIRDIKPPLKLKGSILPPALSLLALAAIVAGFFFWYRRYRRRPADAASGIPAEPPYLTALRELERLRLSGLPAEGRVKEFYVALADIIRTYLSAVYGIETLDRTTAEIYAQLRERTDARRTVGAVREFFEACDLVKFARHRPDEKFCLDDLDKAKKIVEISMSAPANGVAPLSGAPAA